RGINHASCLLWRGGSAPPSLVFKDFCLNVSGGRQGVERFRGRSPREGDKGDKGGLGRRRGAINWVWLWGGAARGFAHIGIMRTLLTHGIVPHIVVGTSIGAVVGGAFAAGHLDKLEEWARSLQVRNVLGYLDIRLNGSGLIGGERLAAQLESAM